MTSPYRPVPDPPPPKSNWKVGDRVTVRYRPTTGTLLRELEGERGEVMQVMDVEVPGAADQCVRVRFSTETWERLPHQTQDRMTAVQKILERLSRPWPFVRLKTIGAEAWMFGGDLA